MCQEGALVLYMIYNNTILYCLSTTPDNKVSWVVEKVIAC